MFYVVLYSYVQPYRQFYINVLETINLTSIILLITSAPIAKYKVIISVASNNITLIHLQDLLFSDDHTFNVDQCGQVIEMSKHAILLIPLYYIPLVLLLVLAIHKFAIKFKLYFTKWLVLFST